MKLDIYQTLNKLKSKQPIERIQVKYIYQDEIDGQIKERELSDSTASTLNNKPNPAKLIHDSVFG